MTNNMRTAIVTGGGSGIGQAVGLALCAAGWTVVIAGRKVETLERTRQLAQGSGLIETHIADVSDDASVEHSLLLWSNGTVASHFCSTMPE